MWYPTLPRRWATSPAIELPAIVVCAVLLGALLVTSPFVATLAAGSLFAVGLMSVTPQLMVLAYLGFVLVQDLLLNFVSDTPWTYLVLKRADESILLVLLVATVARHTSLRDPTLRKAYAFLFAALAFGAVSTLVYADNWMLAVLDVFLLTKGFLVFYVVSHVPVRRDQIARPLELALVAGCVCLVAAVVDLALGDAYRALVHHPRSVGFRLGTAAVVSIFEHEGIAGWFFAFCACIALAFWAVRQRWFYLALCFAFTVGSVLTLRRKPIVGLLAVFGIALLTSARAKRTRQTLLAAGLIIGSLVWASGELIAGIFQEMLGQYLFAADPMAHPRNAMFVASLRIGVDHFPLGVGLARFGGWVSALYYSPVYDEYGLSSIYGLSPSEPGCLQDVFWPHVIGELGFIGAGMFIAALAYLVRPHLRAASSVDGDVRIVQLAALFCFVEAAFESFGWVIYENTLAASCLFALLALATVAIRLHSVEPSRAS